MVVRRPWKCTTCWIVLCCLFSCVSCGGPEYEVAAVDGVLLIRGKPGHKVRIEFIPTEGVIGPRSFAETDSDGHFTLKLMLRDGSAPPGAVVGSHKVTLSDMQLAESETGRGVPIRFGPDYTLFGSTPLTQEVKPGEQTIELRIP